MVRQQFSFLGQTHGIDTMRLEHDDGKIGTDGNNHQWQKQVVSSRKLGYEEHAGQRSVHDPTHDPRHSHQGKVLLGQISLISISLLKCEKTNRQYNPDTTKVRRYRRNRPAIRGTRGKDLEQNNQYEVYQQ